MSTTSVTSKGQVTIPKKYRQQLNINKSTKLSFTKYKNGLYVEKVPTIKEMAGFLKFKGKAPTQKQIDKDIEQGFIDDYLKSIN